MYKNKPRNHISVSLYINEYSYAFSFSVLQLASNTLLILPQRVLLFLYVSSSIDFVLYKSCNQPSVSMHSFKEISNLESMSALL